MGIAMGTGTVMNACVTILCILPNGCVRSRLGVLDCTVSLN